MNKHKSHHPKLLQVTKPIIDISKETHIATGIVSIEFDQPCESKTDLSISFTLFNRFSNYPSHYTLYYTIETNLTNTLMTLLFFLKHKCPDLYRRKHLIMEFIYKPFLRVKFNYSNCKEDKTTKLKGGVYAIAPSVIQEKDCLICGGWVFAIYQRRDLTYRNIIDNVWDECILSLSLYRHNQLLTGYKSGKLKLWTIESFNVVKFINCFYNKFASSILAIYYTDIIIFFECNAITIWTELEEEIYSYKSEEAIEIKCSEVYHDKKHAITNIFFGEHDGKLKLLKINKENIDKVSITTLPNETDKGVFALKFVKELSILLLGTKKGVQLLKISNDGNIELKEYFYLSKEITYMIYLIHKNIMYLFCGGKESLNLIHLQL